MPTVYSLLIESKREGMMSIHLSVLLDFHQRLNGNILEENHILT